MIHVRDLLLFVVNNNPSITLRIKGGGEKTYNEDISRIVIIIFPHHLGTVPETKPIDGEHNEVDDSHRKSHCDPFLDPRSLGIIQMFTVPTMRKFIRDT